MLVVVQVPVEHRPAHVHGAPLRASHRPPAAVGGLHRHALEARASHAAHARSREEAR